MNKDLLGLLILVVVFGSPALLSLLSYRAKRLRLELLHQERMAAIEKGVPLPELPVLDDEPRPRPAPSFGRVVAVFGIISLFGGAGAMAGLLISPDEVNRYWALPLPLVFVGIGMLLYAFFTRTSGR